MEWQNIVHVVVMAYVTNTTQKICAGNPSKRVSAEGKIVASAT